MRNASTHSIVTQMSKVGDDEGERERRRGWGSVRNGSQRLAAVGLEAVHGLLLADTTRNEINMDFEGDTSMKATKNIETLERHYDKLGVDVVKVERTLEGDLIADGFCCKTCGNLFMPDGPRVRNRHRCPNGCNGDVH